MLCKQRYTLNDISVINIYENGTLLIIKNMLRNCHILDMLHFLLFGILFVSHQLTYCGISNKPEK
jgi:hypothetical protein